MKKNFKFWVFTALFLLLCAGCSTKNTSGQGQATTAKPAPQVRVVAIPGATATLPSEQGTSVLTPEPSATTSGNQESYVEPTPDEDALINQIQAMMDDIDRKIRNETFQFK